MKRSREEGEIHSVKSNQAGKEYQKHPVESDQRFKFYIHQWMKDVSHVKENFKQLKEVKNPSRMLPMASILDLYTLKLNKLDSKGSTDGLKGTGFLFDERMGKHCSPDPKDYERPGRVERTLEHLKLTGVLNCCQMIPFRGLKNKDLLLVHSRDHIDYVDQLDFFSEIKKEGYFVVGQDLYACKFTPVAARLAAGAVAAAGLSVLNGDVQNCFALVRPPGHHAHADHPSGFCFFNNVAAASRVVQRESLSLYNKEAKILILDWDVHHCDGTEEIFYNDASVLVISIHQYGNRRGHVLRKASSRPNCDHGYDNNNAVVSSKALPDSIQKESPFDAQNPPLEEINNAVGSPGYSESSHLLPQDHVAEVMISSRRNKSAVDYAKFAALIKEDDHDVQEYFGVAPVDSSSSSVESSCSLSSSPRRRHPDNSVGFSSADDETQETKEPFYPGTGHLERVGGDSNPEAVGKNINIPWPTHGMGDLEYIQIISEFILPIAKEFDPSIVFISCGFDSAKDDLLGSMNITPSGYYHMTKLITSVFPKCVVALEGGYNISNVACCSEAVIHALLESSNSETPQSAMLHVQSKALIGKLKKSFAPYWKCLREEENTTSWSKE